MAAVPCPNCGFHERDGARSVDSTQSGHKDRMGDEPGTLKKECQNIFKFHGLLTIYNTLVGDVSQTKGTKLLSKHYCNRKEFLDDVDSLCTIGVVKNRLIGVITHMDKKEVEFFIENNANGSSQSKSYLTALELCFNYWLDSHITSQKLAIVTTGDHLTISMAREEQPAENDSANTEIREKAEKLKNQMLNKNSDWQVFSVSMAPSLEVLKNVDVANAIGAMEGLVQAILGPQATVKKVGK